MRRLPIYFLLDVSESMVGENLYHLEAGLRKIIGDLRADPHALESVWVSIIAFAGQVREVTALTELISVQVPQLPVGGGTSLGRALMFVMDQIETKVKKNSPDEKGDWKPIIFLITDGKPTDDVAHALGRWKQYADKTTLVAISIGRSADLRVLNQLTGAEKVLTLEDSTGEGFGKFVAWVTQTVQARSRSVGDAVKEEVLPEIDNSFLKKLSLDKPIETVDETSAYFVSKCQKSKLPYISRYEPVASGVPGLRADKTGLGYQLSGCYPVSNSYFEMSSDQPSVATVQADALFGAPGCPHCGNPIGFAMCTCGNTFCISGPGDQTCPWCETKGNFSRIEAGAEMPEITRARG